MDFHDSDHNLDDEYDEEVVENKTIPATMENADEEWARLGEDVVQSNYA